MFWYHLHICGYNKHISARGRKTVYKHITVLYPRCKVFKKKSQMLPVLIEQLKGYRGKITEIWKGVAVSSELKMITNDDDDYDDDICAHTHEHAYVCMCTYILLNNFS